jgi:peptidyl-prolyl cis-trans isomerase, cyclophilin-type
MDVVEKIGKVKTDKNDKPVDSVIINSITIEPIKDDASK